MLKKIILSLVFSFALTGVIITVSWTAAYVSSSPSFRMEYDSLNNEGGLGSTTNYNVEDTMGEDAIGISSSANFKIKAGFQQMREINLSISNPSDVVMAPSIGGLTGGTSNGTATWTVATDNPGGYTLSVRALSTPAMQSSNSTIADYTPANSSVPDFNWSIASNASEFGYSPESTDLISKFKDNGFNTCATGSSQTPDKCWYNFKTSNETICQSIARNDPSGTATDFKLRAEVGAAKHQKNGTYVAELVVTAVAN